MPCTCTPCCTDCCTVLRDNKYPFYVTSLMMLLFMSNQLDRYVLIATNVQMAGDINFGDKVCNVSNTTAVKHYIDTHPDQNYSLKTFCKNDTRCNQHSNCSEYCDWQYTGTGLQYQLLAGPLFMVLFSATGVPVSIILERTTVNRKNVVTFCATLWSIMIILTGFSQEYWHLVVTRLGLAIFEAPFTAFAGSIISSYFLPSLRGLGLAIFHWGVYVGLGVAFGLNMLVDALGWRWAYWIAGIPGVILGLLNLCTVKEPQKEITGYQKTPKEVQIQDSDEESPPEQPFCSVLFVVILCAAAMRCGGGYVFNYNISNYFHLYYPKFPYEHFMTWVPVAMGFCGALLGGVISDRAATRYGLTGRMVVFCISVFISIPLSIGVLYLDPPWCFIILMPNYLVIEMWGSIAMTASAEQAPRGRHTSAIAVYVFSINFFGGNLNLLVPPLKSIIGLRYTLMILYPGVYVLSFIFSLIAIPLAMKRQRKKTVGEISEEEEERRPLLS